MRKDTALLPFNSGLLNEYTINKHNKRNIEAAEDRKHIIEQTFLDFGVDAKVKDYIVGTSYTRYNLELANNCSIRTVTNIILDVQIRLGGLSVRFDIASIGSVNPGLEIENPVSETISFKELYEGLPSVNEHPLAIPLGKKVNGEIVWMDLPNAPHVLIGGTTGSGKSMFINSLITSLIMRNSPESLKLVLFDPKRVELNRYKDEPHLLCPIIHDIHTAKKVLEKLNEEMEERYDAFCRTYCCNLSEYNEEVEQNGVAKYPYIVAVIDEYADLVDQDKSISFPIVSLAQKARAAGIHLIISTQRPTTNVITGVIKANMPTHIAFMVMNPIDSLTLIGEGGAEKLIGQGDMLVQSHLVSRLGLTRLQGSYIHRDEINRVVKYCKEHYETKYNPNFLVEKETKPVVVPSFDIEEDRYESVKDWVLTQDYMSISRIQRECGLGFNRAGRYFLRLQQEGIISNETTKLGCPVIKK